MKHGVLRYFIAAVLIGFGVILVLDNIGMIDSDFSEAWYYIYPTFFVLLGIKWMFNFFQRGGSRWIGGSFLMIFGSLLILGRLEQTSITFAFSDIFKLWPLLIIYFGFSLVGFTSRRHRTHVHVSTKDKGKWTEGRKWGRFTAVGDYSFEQDNWRLQPINITNAAGDYYFDFTKAFIPDENIPIKINSWAGEVRMLIPENLPCKIDAQAKAGEIRLFGQSADGINRSLSYESPDYETAQQKLTIDIDLKAGSVRVDRV